MGWSLCHATCPGKKTPENVTQVLTDAALRLVSTISEHDVPKSVLVNSDQTGVTYSAGGLATWAPINSKQVEVLGKDERQTFTLMVGISMSGEVLPFQAIYSGKTPASLPTDEAPDYTKATQELKFRLESSGTDTHWSTIKTMQSYVTNILVPYFESHRKRLNQPDQLCVWQIDCWSVHKSIEFRSWMWKSYPWIRIHYVPANCTGLFQPCDVGIQRILKLAIRRTALKDIVDDTMVQLNKGAKPEKVVFVKKIGVIRDRSVSWLVNAYEAINNRELVEKVTHFLKYIKSLFLTKFIQAFKLCLVEKDGLNLSYECLTSKKARDTLAERIAASPEFERSLQRPGTIGEEDDDEFDEDDPMVDVTYDEIDSSRMINEEVGTLVLQEPGHLMGEQDAKSDDGDMHIVGENVERYTGHQFSSRAATTWWMEWDAMSHV